MKKSLVRWAVMFGCLSVMVACASHEKASSPRTVASELPLKNATAKDLSERFSLLDLFSMHSSYWTTAQDAQGNSTILRFMAFALKPTANRVDPDSGNGRLLIYMEDPADHEKFNVVVDNEKFMWTAPFAGAEPSLSLNRKNSLLIQTGNEGIGRNAWTQTVTAAFRNNQIVVAGYDYTSYDKLQEYPAVNCSVNLLTGQVVYQETDVRTDKPGRRFASRNNQFRKTVLLQDWSETDSEAMFNEACKKPVPQQKAPLKRNSAR